MSEKTVFFFGTGAIAIVSGVAGVAAAALNAEGEAADEDEAADEAADAGFVLVVEAAASWRT